ncbi:MAG: hypothetical protein ACR2JB_14950 [Bryobacteraceae bacterium]
MNADETYDSLMLCMVKAVRRYDPYYNEKVKAVAGLIEGVLHDRKKFTASDISRHLGYDGTSYVRLLCKRAFLLAGGSPSGEAQYERSDFWPPPKAFFQSGGGTICRARFNSEPHAYRHRLHDPRVDQRAPVGALGRSHQERPPLTLLCFCAFHGLGTDFPDV